MIDTTLIKDRLLYLALQGKLVGQKTTEESASKMVSRVSKELNAVDFKANCDASEIPFDIPDNWCWCRLSDIGRTNIGLTYHPEDIVNDGTIVVRSSNIINGKMDYNDIVKVNCSIRDNQYLDNNDIVVCARNGSKALVGKCAIYEGDSRTVAFGAFMAVFRTQYFKYVYYYLQTPVFRRYFSNDDTKQINQVTQSILKNALIPLPPYEEQIRIVDRVEEILAVLDNIDSLQSRYATNVKVLKNKLIDAGICGKLTEQLPEDGDAEDLYSQIQDEKTRLIKEGKIKKEKALPEITEDEIPFEIPANWTWVRISDIARKIWAGGDKPKDFSEIKTTELNVPVVANGISDDGILGYTAEAKASANTITVAGRGTIGYCTYRDYEYCPIVRLIVIEPCKGINPKYLRYVMERLPEKSVGSSIPQLTVPMLRPKLIPLPPIAEQIRIVEILERLISFF